MRTPFFLGIAKTGEMPDSGSYLRFKAPKISRVQNRACPLLPVNLPAWAGRQYLESKGHPWVVACR